MILASLILSLAFIVCMCVLIKIGEEGEKSSSFSTDNIIKQPEIHIHNNNNSHGGYSNSHGGSSNSRGYGGDSMSNSESMSDSNSNSDSNSISDSNITSNINSKNDNVNTTNNITTDNVSEDMVKEELAQLRNELKRKQRLDMEILDKLDEFVNK